MAGMLTIQIPPAELRKVKRKLERLQKAAQIKLVRDSLKVATTPMRKALIAAAPVGDGPNKGLLKKSIKTKVKTYRTGLTVVTITGPDSKVEKPLPPSRSGKKRTQRPARYVHLIEFGSKKVKANPFTRRTFALMKSVVVAKFVSDLSRRVIKFARKT